MESIGMWQQVGFLADIFDRFKRHGLSVDLIGSSETNVTVSKYEFGSDQLLSLNNRNEGRSFFHLDALGSTVNLTQPNGSARQSIFYDAWGIERDRIGSSANNFTFTGHELDEETGLIYAKARFYDPDIGRFLSQDIVLGNVANPPSLHRYYYVQQNPLIFVDPTGNIAFIQNIREKLKTTRQDTIDAGVDIAENSTVQRIFGASRAIASTAGVLAGVAGFADSTLGLINFGGNLAVGLAAPFAPESEFVLQSAEEVGSALEDVGAAARTVKEMGVAGTGRAALGLAKSGGDKLFAALRARK